MIACEMRNVVELKWCSLCMWFSGCVKIDWLWSFSDDV